MVIRNVSVCGGKQTYLNHTYYSPCFLDCTWGLFWILISPNIQEVGVSRTGIIFSENGKPVTVGFAHVPWLSVIEMNVVSKVVNWYYSFFYFKHLWIDALAINYFRVWFIVWTQQISYLPNVSYRIYQTSIYSIIYHHICKCMHAKLTQKLQNHSRECN
jgi:hypothetical protein